VIEIAVANSEQAETVLNTEGIVGKVVDIDLIEVHGDDYFDALDILSDAFLLVEIVELVV